MASETTQPVRERARELFAALTSGEYDNFGLMSVTYDGEPTECIVAFENGNDGDGSYIDVVPIAIFPTQAMLDRLRDPEGFTPEVHS